MLKLLETMRSLRSETGCPWDREQTHLTLRPYLLEEAAEAVDALSLGDDEQVIGELGDVLLQVAFHAVIAEEEDRYTYADIEQGIVSKLVRRHPHVFGSVQAITAEDVTRNWAEIKRAERAGQDKTPAQSIPASLGALAREQQAQKHLPGEPAGRESVMEHLAIMPTTEEAFAEALSRIVRWAASCGVDAEVALRSHTARNLP